MLWNSGRKIGSSFAFRLTLKYSLLFGFTLVAVFAVSQFFLSAELLKGIDRQLMEEAGEIEYLYKNATRTQVRHEISMEVNTAGEEAVFFRFKPAGLDTFIESSLTHWAGFDFAGLTQRMPSPGHNRFLTLPFAAGDAGIRLILVTLDDGSLIQIGQSLEAYASFIGHFRRVFGFSLLFMMFAAVLFGWLNARQAMAGVKRITRAARSITEGNLDQRVEPGREGDEIEELGLVFNAMVARIQALLEDLKRVTSSIAHDLRSPITRMRGIAETTRISADNLGECRHMAETVVEECDRLENMIGTILEIAQTDAGLAEVRLKSVNLAEVVENGCELFRPVMEDKGLSFTLTLPDHPVSLMTDLTKVQRMIANLLDNAIKFTPAGGSVQVALIDCPGRVELRFTDTGIGIEETVIQRIFDPFFRGDASRAAAGNGLGLSLVKSMVQSLEGEVLVQSTPARGSEFTLILPKRDIHSAV